MSTRKAASSTSLGTALRSAVLASVVVPSFAQAQMFSYGGTMRRPVQALSFVTYFVDFEYNGEAEPENLLDFSDPAYGVMYNRPSFAASIVWGKPARVGGEGSNSLVDATVTLWGTLYRSRGSSAQQFGIPIVIHSGFRSVDPEFSTSTNDRFNYTNLGIGAGAAFHSELASKIWLELRAWPVIAMTFRSFEGFAGSSFLVDTDAQLHLVELFGSVGLSLGYGFRFQDWNNDETGLPGGVLRADQFDYKSSQHMLRAGVNF